MGAMAFTSTVVALGTVALVVLSSALAAYPLARMEFRGRNAVFALFVGSLMIPNVVTLVPQYLLVQRLGWLSTYQGLIVPDAATTFAFGVFLLRQFFLTVPHEIEEAARIDGASVWDEPALAALAIFAFRTSWNDFIRPLIPVN